MKLTTKLHLALALAIGATMFTASALAGPDPANRWPAGFTTRVKTMDQTMKCCQPKEKVALACKDCNTVNEKKGEDEKGIMAWFKPESTHGCSGCGGKITVKRLGGGKGPTVGAYKHVCSKCGPDSAFTCATHKA